MVRLFRLGGVYRLGARLVDRITKYARRVQLYYSRLYHIILYYVMYYRVILYYVILCYVILYHIVIYYVIHYVCAIRSQ